MLERVSDSPLAYAWRGFASACECEALVAHGKAAREFALASGAQLVYGVEGFSRVVQMNGKLYAKVDEERGGLSATAQALVDRFDEVATDFLALPPLQQEQVVNFTPRVSDGGPGLLNGLHVDTYNDEPRRFATSLLYLRTVEHGGETLFASHPTGAALLARSVESTIDAPGCDELTVDLEATCRSLVSPCQGTLLLFFVRGAGGAVDPAAFHGSARPLSCDKWTLQTFWAVPSDADMETYARGRVAHVMSRSSP